MAGSIQYIKIARIDANGVDITTSLESLSTLVIPSGSSSLTYQINNKTRYPSYYLLLVTPPTNTNISTAITSSVPYKVRTIPTSNNGIAAVQYSAMPVSLGNISVDNLNLVKSATSNINPGAGDLNYFDPQTDMQGKQLHVSLIGSASVDGNTGQGFLSIRKGTLDDFNAGAGSSTNIAGTPINPNATSSFDLSTTTTLELGQILYLLVNENVNNFNATNINFTFNTLLNISSSQATGSSKRELSIEPFFTSPFYGTDCDVTYGNASQPVSNPFLQDIDYGDGTIIPINNAAIISGSATRGTVPESYYTSLPSINSKYNGAKNQSSDVNVGQTPSISLNQSLVAYVDYIKDATPIINGKSIANVKYLINENGDAISPNLSNTTVIDAQNNFEDNKEIDVSLIEPPEGTGMQILNGIKTIIKGGYRVEPILYTQTLSGFSNTIPMETSSLTPVEDVRSENTDTTGPNYYPNANVGHIYQFNQENTTLPGKAYYNHTTGKYTVTSNVENSGVTLIFKTQLRGGVGNFISGQGPQNPGNVRIQIIHDKTANGGGLTVIGDNNGFWTPTYFDSAHPPSEYGTLESPLVTGTIASGEYATNDTFYVKINVNFYVSTSYLSPITIFDSSSPFQYPYFNITSIPSPTGIDPISGNIWGISGSSPSSTISSSNNNLLLSYGILKQDFITGSGMDETQQVFTVQPGDQFKFQDDESKVYEVASVIEPSQDPNGNLTVNFSKILPPSAAINLNYFLIRRFVPDGASIIFDELKPGINPSGPAFIKPRFTSEALDKDIDQFIQDLKSKNLLT